MPENTKVNIMHMVAALLHKYDKSAGIVINQIGVMKMILPVLESCVLSYQSRQWYKHITADRKFCNTDMT